MLHECSGGCLKDPLTQQEKRKGDMSTWPWGAVTLGQEAAGESGYSPPVVCTLKGIISAQQSSGSL